VVNASVRAGILVVNGELVGNVHASERVELSGKARVFGDLESPIVVLEEGVMFEGHCRMPRPGAAESSREASVVPLKRS
jgi:cytoskeletal protein CcmA (bactofilin family)